MGVVIDGKAVASELEESTAQDVSSLKASGVEPGLAVVLVGDNPASRVYVNMKKKVCARVGVYSEEHVLPGDVSQEALLELVEQLNANPAIHGILVQLPLPDQIDESVVLNRVDPSKDVDGFHPINIGRLVLGEPSFVPCTPAGVLELIDRTGVEIKGQNAVIVGRSNIVGKPVAHLLLARHATVTMCHSRTRDLAGECLRGDILVVAAGRPELVTGDMVKEGAVVIDVGVNRTDDGLVGDVHFESAKERAGFITPVPGGVGPMTIAMLLRNTVTSAERMSAG